MVWKGKNPSGGVAFGFGLRWRGRHSPLRGCSARFASPKAKIHCRSLTHNFQTGSYILATTNLNAPLANWIIIRTNQFDSLGNFSVTLTNALGTAQSNVFYRLQLQ